MTEVTHSEDPRIAGCCRKRAAVDLDFAELNPRIQGLMGDWTRAGVASSGLTLSTGQESSRRQLGE